MRKRLKKLCIAAAVLAALGVILCVVAFVGSKKAGTELFSQTENEDGNYVYDYGFNGEAIKKLSVSTKYAHRACQLCRTEFQNGGKRDNDND